MRPLKDARTIVAAIILIAVALAASLIPLRTTFNITASVQVLRLVTGEEHRSAWYLRQARVFKEFESAPRLFTGTVRVMPGTEVIFERVGNGPLRIRCQADQDDRPIAELRPDSSDPPLLAHRRLVIVVSPERPNADGGAMMILPVSGTVVLGAEPSEHGTEKPALLLGGQIALLGHSLLGDERYEAGRAELDLGDHVVIKESGDAYGFLVLGADRDMTAVFRVIARRVQVHRFGARGYGLYASALSRLKNDTGVQLVWGASVFLIGGLMRLRKRR